MGPQARVPCPRCGGAIHPVAGRCKHCKADLVELRTGIPQSPTSLPSLGNRTVNEPATAAPRARPRSGRMPQAAPLTAEFSLGSQLPSANQILPVRPTAWVLTTAKSAPAAWPMIAIALSVLAIILSIGAIVS